MGCGASQANENNQIAPVNDKYSRKEMIGVGHHGRVYKCLHHLDSKQYAMKVIDRSSNGINQKNMFKIKQEVTKLIGLNHPSITSYRMIDLKSNEVEIVMDLAKDFNLKKYLQKNGGLSENVAASFICQILQGLYYLHSSGILHRDIKSSNILMFPNGKVKLSDYAIAHYYDKRLINLQSEQFQSNYRNSVYEIDCFRSDSMVYMAPEVVKKISFTDQSDVWSVGCTLIQMLTGKPPWTGANSNMEETIKLISSGMHPPLPTEISRQCQNFLESAMESVPSQRMKVYQLLRHPFLKDHFKITDQSPIKRQDKFKSAKKQEKIEKDKPKTRNSSSRNQQEKLKAKVPGDFKELLNSPILPELKLKPNQKSPQETPQRKFIKQHNRKHDRSDKLAKLKSAVDNLSIANSRYENTSTINRDQILPKIVEEDIDMIYLNNKKVKNKSIKNNQNQDRSQTTFKRKQYTQPTPLNQNPSIEYLNSPQFSKKNGSGRYKMSIPNTQDSLEKELSHRFETQPSLLNQNMSNDKEYFKKPLKLLKRKLRESKMMSELSKNVNIEKNRVPSQIAENIENNSLFQEDDYRLRSNTEISHQQQVIDTLVARAQRNRYINEQLYFKKQKEDRQNKWQQQLKKGSQILKKQFSNRYAYNVQMPRIQN